MRLILCSILFMLLPASLPAAEQVAGTRIQISATASAIQTNDEVVISFRVEQQGKVADSVRNDVNRTSKKISRLLKHEKGITLQTISRNMQPIWQYIPNKPRLRTGWRMVQTSQISSQHLTAIPDWLDAIESAGAHLSGLSFRVSATVQAKLRESLTMKAIARFRSKARAMAKALDADSFRILSLNTQSISPQPRRYRAEMAMMAKSADAPQPSLAAGENRVSVTVSGEITLPFKDYPG